MMLAPIFWLPFSLALVVANLAYGDWLFAAISAVSAIGWAVVGLAQGWRS